VEKPRLEDSLSSARGGAKFAFDFIRKIEEKDD
jgi:hypothetical protein